MARTKLPKGVFFDHSELGVHLRVAAWLRARPHLLWAHVPNGEYRSGWAAKRVGLMGLLPGMPDLLVFTRPPLFKQCVGAAIELKREKGGVLAMHQGVILNRLAQNGWLTIVAHGYSAAIEHLILAGYNEPGPW